VKWPRLPKSSLEQKHTNARQRERGGGAERRRRRRRRRMEAAPRVLLVLRGASHRNREINFLFDKCGLAGYKCQMWQGFGNGPTGVRGGRGGV